MNQCYHGSAVRAAVERLARRRVPGADSRSGPAGAGRAGTVGATDVHREHRRLFVPTVDVSGMDVTVYGPLRSATGGKRVAVDPDGTTVRAVLDALVAAYPRAESHLTDGTGVLRPSVRVTVDGEAAALDDECPPDAAVAVFPAMRGG